MSDTIYVMSEYQLRNETYRCSDEAAVSRPNTYEHIIHTRLEHILFAPA